MQKVTRSRSFLPKSILITTLGLITCIGYNAAATDVVTDPVGFITLTAVGGGTPTAPKYTFQGLGMTQVPAALGSITSFATNDLTVGTTLVAGAYAPVAGGPNPAYFVEVTDGANPGLLDDITGNTATDIYTANSDAANITGATKFKVYPHWTIGTVFGPQNQAGLLGGGSSAAADEVRVFNPLAQTSATYYYKTTGLGGTGWRSGGSSSINQTNAVLYIEQGIVIARKTSGDVTNKLVGAVKLTNTISVIVSGGTATAPKYTYAANVYPAGIPLGTSGLYTGNPATGLGGGGSSASADEVRIFNPATQTSTTYFFKTTGLGGTGWRSGGSSSIDQSAAQIPLGVTTVIARKVTGTFSWSMPQPFVK